VTETRTTNTTTGKSPPTKPKSTSSTDQSKTAAAVTKRSQYGNKAGTRAAVAKCQRQLNLRGEDNKEAEKQKSVRKNYGQFLLMDEVRRMHGFIPCIRLLIVYIQIQTLLGSSVGSFVDYLKGIFTDSC
jgi:hypothetical protein